MQGALTRKMRDENGFTLIELLVVIIILGILLAIAIPSYLSFRGRANNSAAQANIRARIRSGRVGAVRLLDVPIFSPCLRAPIRLAAVGDR